MEQPSVLPSFCNANGFADDHFDARLSPIAHAHLVDALAILRITNTRNAALTLQVCCALTDVLVQLDIWSAQAQPGDGKSDSLVLLKKWLTVEIGPTDCCLVLDCRSRISSLIATTEDRAFWRSRDSQLQSIHVSFMQFKLLHSHQEAIQRHCEICSRRPDPQSQSKEKLRYTFFEAVFNAARSISETELEISRLLQSTEDERKPKLLPSALSPAASSSFASSQSEQIALMDSNRSASIRRVAALSLKRSRELNSVSTKKVRREQHSKEEVNQEQDNESMEDSEEKEESQADEEEEKENNAGNPDFEESKTNFQTLLALPDDAEVQPAASAASSSSSATAMIFKVYCSLCTFPIISFPQVCHCGLRYHTQCVEQRIRLAKEMGNPEWKCKVCSDSFTFDDVGTLQKILQPWPIAASARLYTCGAAVNPPLGDPIPTPLPSKLLHILDKQQLRSLNHSSDLVARVSLKSPLLDPLIFDPAVLAALATKEVVLIQLPWAESISMQQALSSTKNQQFGKQFSGEAWVMQFGCANNNGEQQMTNEAEQKQHAAAAATASPTSPHVWLSIPSVRELLEHIERDWLQLQTNKTRATPPANMRDRTYIKDVSESLLSKIRNQGFFPTLESQLSKYSEPFVRAEENIAKKNKKSSAEPLNVVAEPDWPMVLAKEFHAHRKHLRQHWVKVRQQQLEPKLKGKHKAKQEAATASPVILPEFFIHPLFLNELQLHRRSLAFLSFVEFDSVMTYDLYLKEGFQFFNLHIEQMLFSFVYHQLEGESLWFIIPFNQLNQLYKLAAEMYHELYDNMELLGNQSIMMGRALLYSKQLFPPLSLLRKHKIDFTMLTLSKGEVLTGHGGCAHFGLSTKPGQTISVASNMVTDAWIKDGLPFLVDYFEWVNEIKAIVPAIESDWQQQQSATPGPAEANSCSVHQLKSPKEFVAKALNLCPPNFACSFVRGLYADLVALECKQEPVGKFSNVPSAMELIQYKHHCTAVIAEIHKCRQFTKDLDASSCRGCDANSDEGHMCHLCLCQGEYASILHTDSMAEQHI